MLSLSGVSLCQIAIASWFLTEHAVPLDTEYLEKNRDFDGLFSPLPYRECCCCSLYQWDLDGGISKRDKLMHGK